MPTKTEVRATFKVIGQPELGEVALDFIDLGGRSISRRMNKARAWSARAGTPDDFHRVETRLDLQIGAGLRAGGAMIRLYLMKGRKIVWQRRLCRDVAKPGLVDLLAIDVAIAAKAALKEDS